MTLELLCNLRRLGIMEKVVIVVKDEEQSKKGPESKDKDENESKKKKSKWTTEKTRNGVRIS